MGIILNNFIYLLLSKDRHDIILKVGGIMNKGYTLIELILVIAILSIAGLISLPIILNKIDNTRKDAAKESAYNLLKVVDNYYTDSLVNNNGNFTEINFICTDKCVDSNGFELVINGTKPSNGEIKIAMDGTITGNVSYYDGEYVFYICNDNIYDEKITSCSPRNVLSIPVSEYNIGDQVNYAGLKWNVLLDNGDNTTLILSNLISNSNYGETYDYDLSIKTKLDEWFNNNDTLIKAKEENKIFSMNFNIGINTYNEYIRIPSKEEIKTNYSMLCQNAWCNINKSYWLITNKELTEEKAWSIDEEGKVILNPINMELGIRPVITVLEQ